MKEGDCVNTLDHQQQQKEGYTCNTVFYPINKMLKKTYIVARTSITVRFTLITASKK